MASLSFSRFLVRNCHPHPLCKLLFLFGSVCYLISLQLRCYSKFPASERSAPPGTTKSYRTARFSPNRKYVDHPVFYYALLAMQLSGYFPPSEMAGTKDDVLQLDPQPALRRLLAI